MKRSHSVWVTGCAGSALALAGLIACQGGVPAQSASAAEQSGGLKRLVINSYNYTDRTIDSFYVDGAWGGNVNLSKETSGGGGGTCCVTWYEGMELPKKYRIRWIADMCKYKVEAGGGVFDRYRSLWKEKDVYLTEPPHGQPKAFEVHFYPDERIEVAVSDDFLAPPRLKLPYDNEARSRPGVDPRWPPCTEEQMRTYTE